MLSTLHFSLALFWAGTGCALAAPAPSRLQTDEAGVSFPASLAINGSMARADVDFADGLAIDLLSPSAFKLDITKNMAPAGAFVVSNGGGEPWVLVNNFSWIMKSTPAAQDIVGKIEAPFDPTTLTSLNVQPSNTFVGKLSTDGTFWVVDETTRNVHNEENNTRIIKLSEMDGEYTLLGRQTLDAANIFIQYGFGATRTLNVSKGGLQSGQFIDGMSLQVASPADLQINAQVVMLNETAPANNGVFLTAYKYIVNSSSPTTPLSARVMLPFTDFLMSRANPSQSLSLFVAHRDPAVGGAFEAITNSTVDVRSQVVTASNLTRVDGEWVILAAL